jgi:ribosome-associated protein
MHGLRDMGEALILLEPKRLAELATEVALPDRLVDAIREARSITAWGGRKRQLQFVGKLMRDVDPEPIRRRLELWAHGHDVDTARQHGLEQWRDRLITEPAALDALSADFPRLDRPRFRALIAKARDERARGGPPHAFRELFRELKALDTTR